MAKHNLNTIASYEKDRQMADELKEISDEVHVNS